MQILSASSLGSGGVAVGGLGKELPGVEGRSFSRNVERFRGGLVFKAYRLLHHSTLDSRAMKKKRSLQERDTLIITNSLRWLKDNRLRTMTTGYEPRSSQDNSTR